MTFYDSIHNSFSEIDIGNLDEFKQSIMNNIEKLPIQPDIKDKLIDNVNKIKDDLTLSKSQRLELKNAVIITNIMKNIVHDNATEFLKGAHIIIEDKGMLYDLLKLDNLIEERYSSHHKFNKADKDGSMQGGKIFHEFLIGKTKDGKTWFQLESRSTKTLTDFIMHMVDYINYKLTGKNIGQYGTSKHVDSNPIEIKSNNVKSTHVSRVNASRTIYGMGR